MYVIECLFNASSSQLWLVEYPLHRLQTDQIIIADMQLFIMGNVTQIIVCTLNAVVYHLIVLRSSASVR